MRKAVIGLLVVAGLGIGTALAFRPASFGPEITRTPATMALARSEMSGVMEVLAGEPTESGSQRLGVAHDDSAYASVWECTPGRFTWTYGWDEIVYVLEGRVTLTHDGHSQELRAGDLVTFHAGSQVTWDIHEKVRKVAFLHRPTLYGRVRKWLGRLT